MLKVSYSLPFLERMDITQLPLDKQQEVIQQHLTMGHLKIVVRFYFGLTKHHHFTARMITLHMSFTKQATAYHWLFEAGGPETLTGKLRWLGRTVRVRSAYEWTPLDYYVVGYCIAHFHIQWKVDFSFSSLNDEGMEMWCKGLTSSGQATENGEIISLKFIDNNITLEGAKCLVNIPHQMLHHLKMLNIGSCNKLDDTDMKIFCELIPKLTSLMKLDLGGNSIGCGNAVQILKCLLNHKIPLKTLNLDSTDVGEEDCIIISELIAHNELETLWIGCNDLTSNSVASIMQGLLQNNTIQNLDISSSKFSEENSVSLASVLQQSDCQLKELNIQSCVITDEGATQLATALTHNHSLTELDMEDNFIADSGAAALGHMLMHNAVLSELKLVGCDITSEGAVQLATALSGNTTLQTLDISFNLIGIEGVEAVSKIIKNNKTRELTANDDGSTLYIKMHQC